MSNLSSDPTDICRDHRDNGAASRDAGLLDRVGVAPLPTFAASGQPATSTAGGRSLYVNPHTTHLRAALEFVNWMTDIEAQRIMATEYGALPANAHVRFDPTIAAAGPVLSVASRTTPTARLSNTPAYPAVSRAIYTNVHAAIAGDVSPEQALRTADQQINGALSAHCPVVCSGTRAARDCAFEHTDQPLSYSFSVGAGACR
jgi:multiple sugar transport system substrate-binding protein